VIAIIDYGAGNLASVVKAIRHLGRECVVTSDANAVLTAEKLIIPGVGNFAATLMICGDREFSRAAAFASPTA
jgi:glutamine amidotransferase